MNTLSKFARRIFSPLEGLVLAMIFAVFFLTVASVAYAVNKVQIKPDGAVAAPCTVWGNTNNALACGKTTAPAAGSTVDVAGIVRVSSSSTAGFAMRWLGALATKPSTSQEGDEYYDTAQHTIAMATATKSDNSAWLKANTATTGAPWTAY